MARQFLHEFIYLWQDLHKLNLDLLVLWGLTRPAQGYGWDKRLRSVDRSCDKNSSCS